MRPVLRLALTAVAFAPGMGCQTSPAEVGAPAISPDEAVAALLSLTESTADEDLKRFRPGLRAAAAEFDAESKTLVIGPARVNPGANTFTLSVVFPNGFLEYTGKFVRRDGGWAAEVVAKRQT